MGRTDWRAAGLACLAIGLAACNGETDGGDREAASFAAKVSPEDFDPLVGDDWEGELTYLDYGDNETEITLPAELAVSRNDRVLDLYFSFPDEPQANGRAEMVISEDGRRMNDETVERRIRTDSGELMVITGQACEDNGAPADCEFTYIVSQDALSITKRVDPEGEGEAFRRNRYVFTR